MVSETEQTAIGKKRLQIVTFQTNIRQQAWVDIVGKKTEDQETTDSVAFKD